MNISNSIRRVATLVAAAAVLSGFSGAAVAAPGDNLIASALSKLTRPELSALLSSPLGVARAGIDDVDTNGGPSISEVLEAYIRQIERFKGPLKFIAADGTEFDCYGDYVEYQWGGYGLPCY